MEECRAATASRPALAPMASSAPARTLALTALALAAFAGNSLLCRAALRGGGVGPATFTALRLASGALVLAPWLIGPGGGGGGMGAVGSGSGAGRRSAWWPAALAAGALAAYALGFSLAYVELSTGTGALLLFGAVQATMLGVGWASGERLGARRGLGLAAALAGVALLVAPGVSAPAPLAALSMALAGIAWGVYSLLGRGAARPAARTARNFALAAPLGILAFALAGRAEPLSLDGALLAVASGGLTSGLGYVAWYAALRGHTATSAAVVQLAVPALTALGGVLLLDEGLTLRLVLASALTLGGILLATLSPRA